MKSMGLSSIIPELVRQRCISIVEEAEAVILRTAFSSSIAEAQDFSAGVYDADAQLLGQARRAVGAFIGTVGLGLRKILKEYPRDTLRPGDVIVTNDPWTGGGHIPDILCIRPVFHQARLVAFAANVAHVSDLGGRPSAEASDVFEEGLLIPPTFLERESVHNAELLRVIQANSRMPTQVLGDLRALSAANALTERRVQELLLSLGLDDLATVSEVLQDRAEAAMRERIRSLPSGTYEGEAVSDGFDESLRIRAAITINDGTITVDFTGTADQVRWGLNTPFNLTYAETVYALRLALGGDIPVLEGSLRPFSVSAPEGCVLNALPPAPTMIRVTVVQNVVGAVMRALSPLVPDHLPPDRAMAHFGGIWAIRFRGVYRAVPSSYQRGGPGHCSGTFAEVYFFNGGVGATGVMDGRSATSMPVNCANVPVEIMESRTPVLFESKRLMPDSGGAGQYRGGLGQVIEVRSLSDAPIDFIPGTNDRMENRPFGLFGGSSGAGGRMEIDNRPCDRRRAQLLSSGQVVRVGIPGGGGVGDPRRREREAVRRDLEEGLVTRIQARQVYGLDGTSISRH
ncbi:MAG: hydantoinase B/oxoprolinase family protein [Candidatus Dormibacteria bacterium]